MDIYKKRTKPQLEYRDEALKREMMVLVAQLNGLDYVPKVKGIARDSKSLYLELEFV